MKVLNTVITLGVLLSANLWAVDIKDEAGRKIANGEFESIASDGGSNSTETEVIHLVNHTCWVTFAFYIQNCDFVATSVATQNNQMSSGYVDQSEAGETPNFYGVAEVELVGNPSEHYWDIYMWYTYTSEINNHHYVWAMDYITQGSGHWDDYPYTAQGSTDPVTIYP
jgi:hypothetical protein